MRDQFQWQKKKDTFVIFSSLKTPILLLHFVLCTFSKKKKISQRGYHIAIELIPEYSLIESSVDFFFLRQNIYIIYRTGFARNGRRSRTRWTRNILIKIRISLFFLSRKIFESVNHARQTTSNTNFTSISTVSKFLPLTLYFYSFYIPYHLEILPLSSLLLFSSLVLSLPFLQFSPPFF